jgi:outer membrane immunogenic protein
MVTLRTSVGLAAAVAVLTGAIPAAADGPRGPAHYGRPYQPSIWQGLYGGLHLGWGDAGSADGIVGGAQIGYNWHTGRLVYGLEGDVSIADISVENPVFEASIDWLATARGRVGYLVTPRVLAYATAGFGIASASASFMGIDQGHDTEMDVVFGLGLEGKVNDAMSLRVEYLAFGNDIDVDVIRAGVNFKLGN